MDASAVASAYRTAFLRLRQLPGFDKLAVLRAEMGVILKTWAARTKPTTVTKAASRARLRVGRAFGVTRTGVFRFTINVGVRSAAILGLVWLKTKSGRWQLVGEVTDEGRFIPTWIHLRSEDWATISRNAQSYAQTISKAIPRAIKSIGLARQSIIQAADDLDIDLATVKSSVRLSASQIDKARAAIASTGQSFKNGAGQQSADMVRASIEAIISYPKAHRIGMDRELLLIVAGRAKYIEQSYAKGAFNSIEGVTRAFPNVFKKPNLVLPK